ncbi:MAG: RNA methyltransferase, partial [Desulfobacterales bacterium]|nr:RNA methyltransferase [Desulfobacterales bacterium]
MEYNDCFSFAEEKFFKMTDFLKSREASALYLSEVEDYLQEEGRELLRQLLIAHLDERGVGDIGPSVTGADGIKRTHKRLRTKKIKTLFGEIEINRIVYSGRGAPSLFPSDGMLNLPSLAVSYGLQKHPVLEIIKNSFDESAESVERRTGVRITREQTKKIITESAKDFKNFYDFKSLREKKEAEPLPLLILTSDGKGVVMRTEDLREETRKKAEDKKADNKRDSHFIINKKKSNAKRMATVASVYEIARFVRKPEDILQEFFFTSDSEKKKIRRPRPKAKRVWAGLENSGDEVINEIFEEALQRDPSNRKEWVVLVDGDPHQIKKFRKFSEKFGVELTIVCDLIHVPGYLWKAGK